MMKNTVGKEDSGQRVVVQFRKFPEWEGKIIELCECCDFGFSGEEK